MEDPINEQVHVQSNESTSVANESDENFTSTGTMPAPPFSISAGDDVNSENDKKGEPVEMPFDLESVKTAKQAMDALKELRSNGVKVMSVLKESEDIVGDLTNLETDTDATLGLLGKIYSKYNGKEDEELSEEDKDDLWSVSQTFAASFEPSYEEIKGFASTRYIEVAKFKKLDNSSTEIQNAMQQAYRNSDDGMIKNISDLISTIDEYNGKGEEMSGYAKMFLPDLKNSKLMKQLDGYSGKIKSFGEKAGEVLEVAQNLNTIYDNIGNAGNDLSGPVKGLESTMFFVDKAINLVDLPGLNFIQGMWNNVYKPMIDVCITGLGKIANLRQDGFDNIIRAKIPHWNEKLIGEDNSAPTAYKGIIDDLVEGGWDVFSFMWDIMCNKRDTIPNEKVVKYFEENYDRINAGTTKELPYEGITPFWSIDPNSLKWWSFGQKYHLWAMFYGTILPYPSKRG